MKIGKWLSAVRYFAVFAVLCSFVLSSIALPVRAADGAGGGCGTGTDDYFFGLPTWYRGLPCENGVIKLSGSDTLNSVVYTIALNIADAAVRIAGVVAVGFIIYGGYMYVLAQGDKSRLETAKKTLQTAIIGLVITVMSSALIGFIVARIYK